MYDAEFICVCGFRFKEHFLETEVSQVQDLENFYIRCPRCGEEASPPLPATGPGKAISQKGLVLRKRLFPVYPQITQIAQISPFRIRHC